MLQRKFRDRCQRTWEKLISIFLENKIGENGEGMSRGLEGTSRDLELLRVFQHQGKGKNHVVWKSSHNTTKATSFQLMTTN